MTLDMQGLSAGLHCTHHNATIASFFAISASFPPTSTTSSRSSPRTNLSYATIGALSRRRQQPHLSNFSSTGTTDFFDSVLRFPVRAFRGVSTTAKDLMRRMLCKDLRLNKRTTSEGLRETFSKFGEVVHATIVSDWVTGYSRVFGFVIYITLEDADKGIMGMDAQFLDGWVIFAEYAKPRVPPTPSPSAFWVIPFIFIYKQRRRHLMPVFLGEVFQTAVTFLF